ncbi:Frataxin CyaY, facilitates iron supply for heme A synthesis or Fe-S cluster assembly [Myxococcus hansupus]|uniref:Frataxin CyaY, facilitates iron supply for heme A synthesis or Fe-S cluster assembly n=2 Tax=Pseudomyxococcus hansupus TaxID=1297742 RepID=A0A0H4WTN6_9BACT|nr:iron donor protein CyaY [Myxococcus hansupus]AKQ64660.1 Frataxin CyaY, facilitates iron supply for heme A synthesis or Fe-S cluster assembly [Myxococcus hansupus]
MDEARYNQLTSAAFKRILAAADDLDPDTLEADSTGDMVTLTAASREKCIINTQRAVRQIWVAGRGQGIHFDYDAATGTWKDDKGRGLELMSFVAGVVRDISGVDLVYPG